MKAAVFLSAVIGFSVASIATAEEFPNMVGTWTGTSEAVVLGNPAHYPDRATEQSIPRSSSADLVLNLTHHDGRRMWGSVTSSNLSEPWIGAFWDDRKSFQAVDADGQIVGRMVGSNTMEIMYTQQVGSTLITSHVVFPRTGD
jgi:hypothetical protein